MRLLYVHNIAMPGPEANTVNAAKMCAAFAANGCEVTLAVLPDRADGDLGARIRAHYDLAQPIRVRPLPRAAARPTIAALSAAMMVRRERPDLVYTRAPHVALAACAVGAPVILEAHTDTDALSALGRMALVRATRHERLRALVVISQALAERLRQRLPRLPCPLIVAHDGADAQPHGALRARSGRFTAGYVGRIYRGKGVELIAALAAHCPWADFHIVGGAAAEAADVTGAPPPANVLFHGPIPHSRVGAMIAGWDAALAPYQRRVLVADGRTDAAPWMSPLKIFEYMAAGKAIVASDLPAIREILSDGVNALLCAPDAAESWATALQELRARPERAAQLGLAARACFEAEHTWVQRARRILDAASAPLFSGSAGNTAETANV